MRKELFAAALLACAASSGPAFALSDAEYRQFVKNPDFRAADGELGIAWKNAKNAMTAEQFAKLKTKQRQWVASGRDEEAESFIESGASCIEAYTSVTLRRVDWLNEQAETADLINSADGPQGLYRRERNGEPATLKARWTDRAGSVLSVSVEALYYVTPENVRSGCFGGESAVTDGEFASEEGVTIRFDGDRAVIVTTDGYKTNGELGMGVTLDGEYRRVR